jgi:hypothetical protein
MDDYRAALARQGIGDGTRGDVVLFRTGWNALQPPRAPGR